MILQLLQATVRHMQGGKKLKLAQPQQFMAPNGYFQQVPQVSIAQTNLKIMLKFAEQFGLTPSARSRIIAGETSKDSSDEMEQILGGDL